MVSKKVLAGILISIFAAVTIIALIPVFLYGFNTEALSFDMGLGLAGSPLTSSSEDDSYTYNDFGSSTTINIDANVIVVNPYNYFFRQFTGPVKTPPERVSIISQYIDVLIQVNITTPSNQEFNLTFTLDDLKNIGDKDINVLLGPNEIPIEEGTYQCWITVILTVSVPDISYEETFSLGPLYVEVNVVLE
jgi:hypothetical protein